ncbi:hypothetical protein BMF94_3185 [Rhodotorula taiwanensis]|uniref:Uncharacterized protein n=1 Tax=Rhodotorula taiwanensis TaxID=741276 RepID=A0A2S5BA42_9BASI|nr:hypothetical protein BMF94_3185 [Rhodotorula taiwanensis]
MALAALIAAYSLAGAICLFIYGGISIAIFLSSLLLIIAFTNYSVVWTSALQFVLSFISIVSIVRAGFMIFRLNGFQDNVVWECSHDRMLYNATVAADPTPLATYDPARVPAAVCSYGFHTVYLAFACALAIDCILQLYQLFMVWRFKTFLRQYWLLRSSPAGV